MRIFPLNFQYHTTQKTSFKKLKLQWISHYVSIGVTKHHGQSNLEKKTSNLEAHVSRRLESLTMTGSMAGMALEQKPRAYMLRQPLKGVGGAHGLLKP